MEKTSAVTIINQLGGNMFIAMTGAKNFMTADNSLTFKIGRNSKSISHVRVTLNANDTYTMEFLRIHGVAANVKAIAEGIYFDMLQNAFTTNTGLYTSL